ncbi:MAG: DNA-binding protein [Desulfobulbaceae bacterium]|nr:DNA-binding protein [Desulfobulbaceae bacterium]
MHLGAVIISLFLALLCQFPNVAQAAWWNTEVAEPGGLDLESGYDANTVTTLSGRITALHLAGPQPQAQVEIVAAEGPVMVVFGPRSYWDEHGLVLEIGDRLTVRGSKAQGRDGVIYLLAQWLSEESRGQELTLRSESGKPAWAGAGNRNGQAGSHGGALRQRGPGRIGGGRMGR